MRSRMKGTAVHKQNEVFSLEYVICSVPGNAVCAQHVQLC